MHTLYIISQFRIFVKHSAEFAADFPDFMEASKTFGGTLYNPVKIMYNIYYLKNTDLPEEI